MVLHKTSLTHMIERITSAVNAINVLNVLAQYRYFTMSVIYL